MTTRAVHPPVLQRAPSWLQGHSCIRLLAAGSPCSLLALTSSTLAPWHPICWKPSCFLLSHAPLECPSESCRHPLIMFRVPMLAYTCHCCPNAPRATLALVNLPLDPPEELPVLTLIQRPAGSTWRGPRARRFPLF